MIKIKILSNNMINQIAAGEVVERPSSIVKELVENSIDAGANFITIEIKNGGISFIQITDNGIGISPEYVKTAFLRHATSKIENIDDLQNILTLGFRGEALGSIAAVSQIDMITKTAMDKLGTYIELHAGEVVDTKSIATNNGTSIRVRNLFYNIPARRKFLKKSTTEAGYISDIVNRLILGNPNVSFKYIINDTIIINSNSGGDLKKCIFNVYGREIVKHLIKIESKNKNFIINGYLGKSEISRNNRTYGSLFINGRFIKSSLIQSAIEDGYKTRLTSGKFPFYVINLELNPSEVDINVHPAKMEVKFGEENEIYCFVLESVTKALKDTNLIQSYESKLIVNKMNSILEKEKSVQRDIRKVKEKNLQLSNNNILDRDINIDKYRNIKTSNKNYNDIKNKEESDIKNKEESQDISKINKNEFLQYLEDDILKIDSVDNLLNQFFKEYKIVGELFNTYWIIEMENKMYMIDQHVAHERVLYEKYLEDYKKTKVVSQRLVIPEIVQVSLLEKDVIKNNLDLLVNFGFQIEFLSECTVGVKGVPSIFKNVVSEVNLFTDIVDVLINCNDIKDIYDTKLKEIATIACRSAIKANNKLSNVEVKELIKNLFKLENPFTCPHGRPIIIEFSKYEIERMFKRT